MTVNDLRKPVPECPFAGNVRRLLLASNWSVHDLARVLGRDVTTVRKTMRENIPTWRTVYQYAEAFGVDPMELLK
jgi:transcriptional regulator with XRE-family HTH domain